MSAQFSDPTVYTPLTLTAPLNRALVQRVRNVIADDHSVLNMHEWIETRSNDDGCDTVACIAGWAWILHDQPNATYTGQWVDYRQYPPGRSTPMVVRMSLEQAAANILGLTAFELDADLFYFDQWPAWAHEHAHASCDEPGGDPDPAAVAEAAVVMLDLLLVVNDPADYRLLVQSFDSLDAARRYVELQQQLQQAVPS